MELFPLCLGNTQVHPLRLGPSLPVYPILQTAVNSSFREWSGRIDQWPCIVTARIDCEPRRQTQCSRHRRYSRWGSEDTRFSFWFLNIVYCCRYNTANNSILEECFHKWLIVVRVVSTMETIYLPVLKLRWELLAYLSSLSLVSKDCTDVVIQIKVSLNHSSVARGDR